MKSDKNYTVGYRRPPAHTQFRTGQSGNPRGRRKRSRNVKTVLRDTLNMMVRAREDGKVRNLPALELLMLKQMQRALNGDIRSFSKILELTMRYPELSEEAPETKATSDDDDRVLEDYLARTSRHQGLGQNPAPESRSLTNNAAGKTPATETPRRESRNAT
jgi:hypothetical protein